MRQESLMQVSGSFLESRNAKIDAPAVCTRKTTMILLSKEKSYIVQITQCRMQR
jgi:hypothetical protein